MPSIAELFVTETLLALVSLLNEVASLKGAKEAGALGSLSYERRAARGQGSRLKTEGGRRRTTGPHFSLGFLR